jgi:hypothetical protein
MTLEFFDGPPVHAKRLYLMGREFAKYAADESQEPELAYNLSGTLYLSQSGWLMLSVANSFARGLFSNMREPGIELPPGHEGGSFNAHITVMRPEEIELVGGPDKITERGKQFAYTLGRFYSVKPDGWSEVDRVWFVKVHSPDLQELRKSYGLSPLPKEGKHAFHVTVAVRRRGVLSRGQTSKVTT